ncbi:MAG TPA: redoxin family protein [Candidatus Omnitrophota bacterium]|nr:redoxin family protein [Candidatus Omnitrophota bacterium]
MKKIIVAVCLVLFLGAFTSYAAGLKVGDKVTDFKLSDALDDKPYSLSAPAFAGKVVYIVYASSSSSDDNDHVTAALKANKDLERLKSENKYAGLGIGNQKDSPVPNFVIKQISKRKQKSSGSIILMDPDFTIGKIWGVPHKVATSVLVDKDRIVRYIYSGKTPAENIPKIVELIKQYSEAK